VAEGAKAITKLVGVDAAGPPVPLELVAHSWTRMVWPTSLPATE
jgi:hypothetical protein